MLSLDRWLGCPGSLSTLLQQLANALAPGDVKQLQNLNLVRVRGDVHERQEGLNVTPGEDGRPILTVLATLVHLVEDVHETASVRFPVLQ